MEREFRFKPWTGSWRYIPLAVNDLTRVTVGGVRAVKAFKSLSLWAGHPGGRSFASRCSEWNPRLWPLRGQFIQWEMPVGNTPKCSFSVSLGSTDLNEHSQWNLTFQNIKFGLWGFSKFEFRPIESFQYRWACGLDSAAQAGGRHSVLSVAVTRMWKFRAPLVLDCFR
jgi:hypothetical protein